MWYGFEPDKFSLRAGLLSLIWFAENGRFIYFLGPFCKMLALSMAQFEFFLSSLSMLSIMFTLLSAKF